MRVLFAILMLTLCAAAASQPGGDSERTPFTELRFTEDGPKIKINDDWYLWRGIDGISYDDLKAFAKIIADNRWRERIGEDLVWVMTEFGSPPGERVDLLVEPVGGGETLLLEQVAMTFTNRERVRRRLDDHIELRELLLVERARDGNIDTQAMFTELTSIIRAKHSYANLLQSDLQILADEEFTRLKGKTDWDSCLLAAQRLVCTLGDGHARIDDWIDAAPMGRLPVLLQNAEGGVVAFVQDRSGYVDSDRPFITEIDGVPIRDWIDAASVYVTDGSPQLVQRRSLRLLRWINLIRDELGHEHSDSVTLTLVGNDGDAKEVRLECVLDRPKYGVWPRNQTRVLDSGIGYFRLERMSPNEDIQRQMMASRSSPSELNGPWKDALVTDFDALSESPSVIIDVRGNGGGSRLPTIALVTQMMARDNAPVVVNAARARVLPSQPIDPKESYLDNRFLYPENWSGWTLEERDAITEFKIRFNPEWNNPNKGFSVWHYMVISPDDTSPKEPREFIVLMDSGCFSATDIFLAACGELPNVTLVGQPSSGGSARSRSHTIESLGTKVIFGSMVSYQPNGELYDGNGVQPDVLVDLLPSDLIGETDNAMTVAEKMLTKP